MSQLHLSRYPEHVFDRVNVHRLRAHRPLAIEKPPDHNRSLHVVNVGAANVTGGIPRSRVWVVLPAGALVHEPGSGSPGGGPRAWSDAAAVVRAAGCPLGSPPWKMRQPRRPTEHTPIAPREPSKSAQKWSGGPSANQDPTHAVQVALARHFLNRPLYAGTLRIRQKDERGKK
jgi:hypothetical protein